MNDYDRFMMAYGFLNVWGMEELQHNIIVYCISPHAEFQRDPL